MSGLIALISFIDFTNHDFFEPTNDSQNISGIYAYANGFDVNYIPFKTPLIVFTDTNDRPVLFTARSFDYRDLPNDNTNFYYYRSHYGLFTHLGAIIMRAIDIDNFRAMKFIFYVFAISISLSVFCLFLLLLFNQTGNMLPPIIATILWGGVKTDINLWFNFGIKLLPILILAFTISKIDKIQNYAKRWLILFPIATISFFIMCLFNYDFMPLIATTMLAIHCYMLNEKNITIKLWLMEGFVIGLGIMTGFVMTVLLHLQLINVGEFVNHVTKHSHLASRTSNNFNYFDLLFYMAPQIILFIILPLFVIYHSIKPSNRLVPIFTLLASFSGLVFWCLFLRHLINHTFHIQQAFYYAALPMLLIIANREDIRIKSENYLTSMFRKI